jgi:hypothetical protein
VSAVQVRPGNAAMMHHALLYVEEGATSVKMDEASAGPGYRASAVRARSSPTRSASGRREYSRGAIRPASPASCRAGRA